MRKRLSRRRLKARFLRGSAIRLEDVYNRRLLDFVTAWRYEMDGPGHVRRYFEPIKITLEEFSAENLRMFFLGEAA